MEKTYSACTGTPGLPSALAPAVDIAWAVASRRRHRFWLEEAPARRHLGASSPTSNPHSNALQSRPGTPFDALRDSRRGGRLQAVY